MPLTRSLSRNFFTVRRSSFHGFDSRRVVGQWVIDAGNTRNLAQKVHRWSRNKTMVDASNSRRNKLASSCQPSSVICPEIAISPLCKKQGVNIGGKRTTLQRNCTICFSFQPGIFRRAVPVSSNKKSFERERVEPRIEPSVFDAAETTLH